MTIGSQTSELGRGLGFYASPPYKIGSQNTPYKLGLDSPQGTKIYHRNSNSPRQIQIHHAKFKFTTANPTSLQQNKFTVANSNSPHLNSNSPLQFQIHHGKFTFITANSNSLRQIQIDSGKFKFITANSNSPHQIQIHLRQFQIHHGKFKFTAENLNSSHQIQIHLWQSQIHHGKFKFTRQFQIHHSKFKFTRQIQFHHVKFKFMTANSVSQECRHGLQGKDGRGGLGTARVSLGPHPFSINCEIFT